jgi:hypothetical protein
MWNFQLFPIFQQGRQGDWSCKTRVKVSGDIDVRCIPVTRASVQVKNTRLFLVSGPQTKEHVGSLTLSITRTAVKQFKSILKLQNEKVVVLYDLSRLLYYKTKVFGAKWIGIAIFRLAGVLREWTASRKHG